MIKRKDIIERNKIFSSHFQTKQFVSMKLEEITKKISADNNDTLIENTDLVDNKRYIMNKATGQTNNNIECT